MLQLASNCCFKIQTAFARVLGTSEASRGMILYMQAFHLAVALTVPLFVWMARFFLHPHEFFHRKWAAPCIIIKSLPCTHKTAANDDVEGARQAHSLWRARGCARRTRGRSSALAQHRGCCSLHAARRCRRAQRQCAHRAQRRERAPRRCGACGRRGSGPARTGRAGAVAAQQRACRRWAWLERRAVCLLRRRLAMRWQTTAPRAAAHGSRP